VPEHFRALAALGPTVHHRRGFAPVAAALAQGEEAAALRDLLEP
jgi:ribonuclease HII